MQDLTKPALPYNDYGSHMQRLFGRKVQKLPVNAGFGCPNRDGTIGRGGCAFCSNRAFTPAYAMGLAPIAGQLRAGMQFFQSKTRGEDVDYLAYFQSFTNTYAPLDELRKKYEEALSVEGVKGLVISTRPDCLTPALFSYLCELKQRTYVQLELGIESLSDRVLAHMHRGHDVQTARRAVDEAFRRGIAVSGHLILGYPGEEDSWDAGAQAFAISGWPLEMLKLHQLQVVRGTPLANEYVRNPQNFHLFSAEEYVETLVRFIASLRPSMVLERLVSQMPRSEVLAPHWGVKPDGIQRRLVELMRRKGWVQGSLYNG